MKTNLSQPALNGLPIIPELFAERTLCRVNRVPLSAWGLLGLFAGGILLSGCSTSKERQLELVAKDWCMTIRASQVIPVYPLTEDVQPGDVFLVQVPVDKQQMIYKEKGFLPLDNHIARLNPGSYHSFYRNSFLAGQTNPMLPRDWIRPPNTNIQPWQPAPHAAFPTYSFSVRKGQGMNLAVPIQGVPVGLSLLNSDAADGSVAIRQARTLGVDTISLYQELKDWASTNNSFLRYFGADAAGKKTNFLRAITRVYVTGEMDVNLRDASSQSGGLDVGAAKPVNLLFPELPKDASNRTEVVARNYTNGWNALESIIAKATEGAKDAAGKFLPGGSLRLAGASARTVSLKEEFSPPVVLGYLAFDCAILKGGVVGPPIPTHAVIDPKIGLGNLLQANPYAAVHAESVNLGVYRMLRALTNDAQAVEIVERLDDLQKFVPNEFTRYGVESATPTNLVLVVRNLDQAALHRPGKGYQNYHSFHNFLNYSIHDLDLALQRNSFELKEGDAEPKTISQQATERPQLEKRLAEYRQMQSNPVEQAARQDTFSSAIGYYFELITK